MSTLPAWQAALATLRPLADDFRAAAKNCTDLYLWVTQDNINLDVYQCAFPITRVIPEPPFSSEADRAAQEIALALTGGFGLTDDKPLPSLTQPFFELVHLYRLPPRDGEESARIAFLCGKAGDVALFRKLAERAGTHLPIRGLTSDSYENAWVDFVTSRVPRHPEYPDSVIVENPHTASATAIDPPAPSPDDEPRLIFDPLRNLVWYRGTAYPFKKNLKAFRILQEIDRTPRGQRITIAELQKRGLRGCKITRELKRIPPPLLALVDRETGRKGGYCIIFPLEK